MANSVETRRRGPIGPSTLIRSYATVALATVAALGIMSQAAPQWAPHEAWGHGVIVAVFAGVLLLRWRSARRGSADAVRAVRIITMVLLVVNVVEACLTFFPIWMRIEMGFIAAMMVMLAVLMARDGRAG